MEKYWPIDIVVGILVVYRPTDILHMSVYRWISLGFIDFIVLYCILLCCCFGVIKNNIIYNVAARVDQHRCTVV